MVKIPRKPEVMCMHAVCGSTKDSHDVVFPVSVMFDCQQCPTVLTVSTKTYSFNLDLSLSNVFYDVQDLLCTVFTCCQSNSGLSYS